MVRIDDLHDMTSIPKKYSIKAIGHMSKALKRPMIVKKRDIWAIDQKPNIL